MQDAADLAFQKPLRKCHNSKFKSLRCIYLNLINSCNKQKLLHSCLDKEKETVGVIAHSD